MSGASVAAVTVAVVVAALVVAATAEPGYKGGGQCHTKYVPYYHTVYEKVS